MVLAAANGDDAFAFQVLDQGWDSAVLVLSSEPKLAVIVPSTGKGEPFVFAGKQRMVVRAADSCYVLPAQSLHQLRRKQLLRVSMPQLAANIEAVGIDLTIRC